MMIRTRRHNGAASPASLGFIIFCMLAFQLLAFPYALVSDSDEGRVLQNSNNNVNNVCTQQPSSASSSDRVIDQVLSHLDSRRTSIESTVLQSYTDHNENATKPSTQYLYDDFRSALEWMAREGVDSPGGGGGDRWTFFLGRDNCDGDGWHVGLANVAAFMSQSMTMVILNDTCDELNWEAIFPNPYAEEPKWYYPLSNACGQRGVSYTSSSFHTCPAGQEDLQCDVDPNLRLKAESGSTFGGYSPPPLECYPRTQQQTVTGHYDPFQEEVINREGLVIPAKTGRTDVEGCCYWGRGALHTGGLCNLGKLNHYLGAKARREGRDSKYPDVDFCTNPGAICGDTRTMEMRWIVALFEWSERVQSYDDGDWNYLTELAKFSEQGDLIGSIQFSLLRGEPSHFIDEVGGVLEQGCPFPPCIKEKPLRLQWRKRRKENFIMALEGVGLPIKSELFRSVEDHFVDSKVRDDFEDVLLLSKSPMDGKMYQSYRYHFTDFMESLRKMSDVGFDGKYFYIGQGREGVDQEGGEGKPPNSGVLNIALFLTYAIEMSILDDACSEHNTQVINGRYPVSNSCGQYGASYQDIVCDGVNEEDAGMECPLDPNQSFSAVTRPLDHRAPQPFKCAPKTQYPVTGYWDEAHLEENHRTAFSNQVGRIDIEGCCWWGRGVLREVARGRCFFGQMNYYIGKRAATEGRPSLYPKIDFCEFPEAICASEHSNELRWVSGFFYWVKTVQSYDEDGWNYIEKLQELSSEVTTTGNYDVSLIMSIDCLVRTGSVDCDSAEDMSAQLNEVMTRITTFSLPTVSPTATLIPTVSPTGHPTVKPTETPTDSPTSTLAPTASPNIFFYPQRQDVDSILNIIEEKREPIESNILNPRVEVEDKKLYTFDDFMTSLRVLADGTVQGTYFYIGHSTIRERKYRKRGLVNIAAFLAHSKTVAVYDSVCDEKNVDSISKKFPISNACGQDGQTYQNLRCDASESDMECPPDPGLQMTAVAPPATSDGQSQGGPPPFFCGPRAYFPFTGYYDGETNTAMNDAPFANRAGRTDVQSCCWWGRGSGQVKGVCMYGKINYYVGARAKKDGRRSLFPSIDFCQNPQAICSGDYSYSLMWVTGMIAWIELVQLHADYSENLESYVEGSMEDDAFIDTVSDILGVDESAKVELRANFKAAVDAMGIRHFR